MHALQRLIKSATISFGQPMPEERCGAREETLQCDLPAIGSSLVVYPAAGFPIRPSGKAQTW